MGGCTTNLPPLARLLLLGVAAAILWPRACRAKSLLHDVDAKRLLKANNTVSCPTPNGTVLLPGEDLMVVGDRGCTIMQCTEQGLDTLEAECWAPRCVQPQRKPRACCLSCPDGDSCRLPSGEVIRADTEYRDSRMICSCPLIKKGLGWDEDLVNAVCRLVTTTAPPPTTRPPTCALPDGDSLGVGLTRVVPDGKNGCRKYECDGRHHLTVSYGECRTLNCVNPVRRPGACCMTCPNDTDSSSGPESYVTSPAPERNATSTLRVLYVDVITFLKLLFGFPVQLGHGNRTVGGQQEDHWNRHGSLRTQDKSNGTQGTQGTHRGNQRGNRWGSHGNQLGSHGNQRGSRGNRLGSHGNRRGSHGNRRGNQSGIQENQRGSHKNQWGSQVGSRGNGSGSQSGSEESGKRKTWRWQWFSHEKKRGCTRKGNGQRGGNPWWLG